MAETSTLTVAIGDKAYPFKRVNLASFKKHLEFMQASARMAREVAAGKAPDAEAAIGYTIEMAEIIHECIARADPTVKLEDIMEGLDQGNLNEAYAKVMQGSGFVPGAAAPGEAKAAAA